ncbi:MAG TPA: DUF6011 domain-containing protein [Candidatus Paceibacterota bacterium]
MARTKKTEEPTASVAEMMRELDEIAASLGIKWGPQDYAGMVFEYTNEPRNSSGERGNSGPPSRPTTRRPTMERGQLPAGITPKQRDFIATLVRDRDVDIDYDIDGLTAKQASALIDMLKKAPYRAAKNPGQRYAGNSAVKPSSNLHAVDAGIYVVDDTVYKVQVSKSTGRPYALRLVINAYGSADFVFESGLIKLIRPEHRISIEDAAEFGVRFGVCCQCGRTLTNPESIERGIGPICLGKL